MITMNHSEVEELCSRAIQIRMPKDADVKTLDQLFTKRNLISLSILYNEIQRLEESEIKDESQKT